MDYFAPKKEIINLDVISLAKRLYSKIVDEISFFFASIKRNGISFSKIRESYKWRVKHENRGDDYKDKVFYVIRKYTPDAGVFSYMNTCVTNLRYCEEKGYIPAVDLQNNKSIYLCENNIGKMNVWDFFFQQPAGYSLIDIQHAKHVIVNDGAYRYGSWAFDIFNHKTDDEFLKYREITHQYIKFSDFVIEKYNRIMNRYFTNTDIICGVLCRGGAYTAYKPINHPIQPSLEDVSKEIDYTIHHFNCNKIYLATDDERAATYLSEKYGDMIVCLKDIFDDEVIRIDSRDSLIQKQKIAKGQNYAASVLMLSKCDCLVAGNTSGSIAARLLSDGYKYEKIFDLGRY